MLCSPDVFDACMCVVMDAVDGCVMHACMMLHCDDVILCLRLRVCLGAGYIMMHASAFAIVVVVVRGCAIVCVVLCVMKCSIRWRDVL